MPADADRSFRTRTSPVSISEIVIEELPSPLRLNVSNPSAPVALCPPPIIIVSSYREPTTEVIASEEATSKFIPLNARSAFTISKPEILLTVVTSKLSLTNIASASPKPPDKSADA